MINSRAIFLEKKVHSSKFAKLYLLYNETRKKRKEIISSIFSQLTEIQSTLKTKLFFGASMKYENCFRKGLNNLRLYDVVNRLPPFYCERWKVTLEEIVPIEEMSIWEIGWKTIWESRRRFSNSTSKVSKFH